MHRVERSSDQVVRPLYQEALTKWVGQIPDDVITDMASIAPMLATLGYDPAANPPAYGVPEIGAQQHQNRDRDEDDDGVDQQQEEQEQQRQYGDTSAGADSKQRHTTARRRRRR